MTLCFANVPVFAQTSEFERGFQAGQASCVNELWTCTVNCTTPAGSLANPTAEGYTRAQALIALGRALNSYYNCKDQIRAGKSVCHKI